MIFNFIFHFGCTNIIFVEYIGFHTPLFNQIKKISSQTILINIFIKPSGFINQYLKYFVEVDTGKYYTLVQHSVDFYLKFITGRCDYRFSCLEVCIIIYSSLQSLNMRIDTYWKYFQIYQNVFFLKVILKIQNV